MINKVILIGRLTRDPLVRGISNGGKVSNFTLACNRRFQNPNQNGPTADFISCVSFGKTAELVEKYLHKGSLIAVEGRIQTGSYDDTTTGKRVYTTDVVVESVQFLETKSSMDSNNQNYNDSMYTANTSYTSNNTTTTNNFSMDYGSDESEDTANFLDIASDDLPF